MKTPIKSVEKGIKGHPIAWGALVFLLGSGTELLVSQRMLGSVALGSILHKLGFASIHPVPGFLLQELALFLGLALFAFAAHLIARIFYAKKGAYSALLTTLFFISGIVSLGATFLNKMVADGAADKPILLVIPLLSLLLYVAAIRECYRIPFLQACVAGVIPFAAAVLFVVV